MSHRAREHAAGWHGPRDRPGFRPRLACLLLVVLLLCAFWAVTAPYICGAERRDRPGPPLPDCRLACRLRGTVIARWGGSGLLRIALSVAVVPATPVALFLLWHLEIATLVLLWHRFPPPRPMFHNDLVDDERTLLPYWYRPMPVTDRLGHWAWADHRDNLLLVVAFGVPETGRGNALGSNRFEYRVKVGPDHQDRYVTLKRATDALVVALPDGSHRSFVLGPGQAKRFHEARVSSNAKNVLREAGELLDPAEKAKLDKFLSGSREPEPQEKRPVPAAQERE